MNNDITCKTVDMHNRRYIGFLPEEKKEEGINEPIMFDQTPMQNSMEILENIGRSQVNMASVPNNSVQSSMKQFLKNPDLIAAQIDFCDSLIDEGCDYEKAIRITDEVFKIMSEETSHS